MITKPAFKFICWSAFIIYLVLLFKITFFQIQLNYVSYRNLQLLHGIDIIKNFQISNWVPGLAIWAIITSGQGLPFIAQNLAGNIIAFIPLGILAPTLCIATRSYRSVIKLALALSGGIEVTQLLAVRGYFDIDDVLLNTAGATAGYYLFSNWLLLLLTKYKLTALLN